MARMPDAEWRPLPSHGGAMRRYDIICLHTMVGTLMGTDAYFRRPNAPANSHFGVGWDGRIFQWLDTSIQSWANKDGNHRVISIETEDKGNAFPAWSGSDVPAFTVHQIKSLSEIVAWACRAHNIPCELIPDAKPGRRGIGYHRQGVPGYMVAGAEQWSSARGKVCPGNRRIAQIPEIIDRARQLLGQGPSNPTAPPPPPPPAPSGAPARLGWNLPRGHYYGNIAGPAASHGGYHANERGFVKNIQQWLIYKGCVPGVPASAWATSGWADGRWENPTDDAMRRWHDRYYRNQPQPAQCWSDDYDRLARA